VNEVSFKQHDKRQVIGSKVNGFTLLAMLTVATCWTIKDSLTRQAGWWRRQWQWRSLHPQPADWANNYERRAAGQRAEQQRMADYYARTTKEREEHENAEARERFAASQRNRQGDEPSQQMLMSVLVHISDLSPTSRDVSNVPLPDVRGFHRPALRLRRPSASRSAGAGRCRHFAAAPTTADSR
jgi:hypothetical protein